MQSKAFQPAIVGGIQMRNRIVRSATHEGTAVKGAVSPAILKMHQDLAQGQVGLIITGYMWFSESDHPTGRTVALNSDAALPGLRQLADNAHKHGAKIMAQISHQSSQLFHAPKGTVFGPSDVPDPMTGIIPTPLSQEQIHTMVKEFAAAAGRAKAAGFDGVEIHGAHGYFLSKFLSPVYNRRTDEYGGGTLQRARIVLEILQETKKVCGREFPVWIKLNCSDFDRNENGLDEADFMIIAKEIARHGIDAIEVSGGTMAGRHTPCRSKKHEAYHLEAARNLAGEIKVPIVLVGGIRNPATIEKILSETEIAAVAMARPLIREPGLVKRWMDGDRKEAACIACNGCFNPEGTVCFHELTGEKKERQKEIMQLMNPKN